jgi:hypothetical protein
MPTATQCTLPCSSLSLFAADPDDDSAQAAVPWPGMTDCATKRCYANNAVSCAASQTIPANAASKAESDWATTSCVAANTGITLYYCVAI